MSLPAPTPEQARWLWFSLTALAVAVLLALAGVLALGLGWVIKQLSPVLLPLAGAGILAYLLDPVVGFLERRGVPRLRAILLVFVIGLVLALVVLGTVVPRVVQQITELVRNVPGYADQFSATLENWSQKPWVQRLPNAIRPEEIWATHGEKIKEWLTTVAPQAAAAVGDWILRQFGRAAAWVGLLAGFFLVPIYVFYFLLEKRRIAGNWTDYLPIQESRAKEELVFILRSINESLIVFFRGQVLVALCVGALTALGFSLIGLRYGLLLGVMTGVLGIVPYLGVMVSIVPAIVLGVVQFHDWRVLLVIAVFVGVQTAEGLFISPKIIGNRVGMHPVTVIVAIMIGTTLLGGILGGVLAIPLTAALRTLMFRYVWRKRSSQGRETSASPGPVARGGDTDSG